MRVTLADYLGYRALRESILDALGRLIDYTDDETDHYHFWDNYSIRQMEAAAKKLNELIALAKAIQLENLPPGA